MMQVRFRCPPALNDLLPRPLPAKAALPEWLKRMPATAEQPDLGLALRTVKQCPPFLDAMGSGFIIPLAVAVRVENGQFAWDWNPPPDHLGDYSRAPLSFHFSEQAQGSPLYDPERVFIKFNNFWTIELPPGWSLLVTHPFNREDLPFRTLSGLVDADLYGDNFIQFPARWLDANFNGVLERGTPIAQCLPVLRQGLELVCEELSGDAAARFQAVRAAVQAEPGVYRRRFRAHKG